MQILYKINASLSEYKDRVEDGTWEFPTYKDTQGHGYYHRPVVNDKNEVIKDLPIKRYKKTKKRKVVTISLLPHQLIPYSKYRLSLITYIMDKWRKVGKNIYNTLNEITRDGVSDELYNMAGSQIYYFRKLFKLAMKKYLLYGKINSIYPLEKFIGLCSDYQYCHGETLGRRYYSRNGGYMNNSQFLFGKASQFRVCRNL
jgi:hypothetical protein